MRLSADRINRKSPYWVIQLDEMTFRFVTRNDHRLTLETAEINFDKYIVYTCMILRNDHPEYEELLNAYREFVKRANSLYQVQPK